MSKERFDKEKAEKKAIYEAMKKFKKEARDGASHKQLGVLIEDEQGKQHRYIPYTRHTKITKK